MVGLMQTMKKIEPFDVAGEMAYVKWYRQGKYEFNGKYVVMIEYFENDPTIDDKDKNS